MARYIDADLLLTDEKTHTLPNGCGRSSGRVVVFVDDIENTPTSDVVPKSEVDRLQKQLKAFDGFDVVPRSEAKERVLFAQKEIAREIFEEIEKIMETLIYDYKKVSRYQDSDTVWYVKDFLLAELKKKYTESRE